MEARTLNNLSAVGILRIKIVYLFLLFLPLVYTVEYFVTANNLHTYDGVSTSDIIGSDVFFEITEPKELGYTYRVRPAKDFGLPFNGTFCGHGISLVPVEPPSGCGWPENAEELKGSVALVERGECSFLSKTVKAEEVGASAIIIANQDPESDEFYIEMIDDNTHREVNIPAGFILGKNGYVMPYNSPPL
ncbi:hypothetical protein C0J52_21503 [Blattella germanica]|nr:hypothetical protein C0J52_21503 [Blattella germanica]